MKLVPAGVSKKTGKPYNAFYACQVQGCTFRPPASESFNGGANRASNGKSSDGAIIRQVAFKGAVELIVAGKIQLSEIHSYTDKFDRIIQSAALPNPLPSAHEDLPVIQQGEDVPFTDDVLPEY